MGLIVLLEISSVCRSVCLSICLSFPLSLFSLLFHRSCPLFPPLILSVPPPACLSVILTFTLCLSVLVSLSPPLYFLLSSWLCFPAEVSVDSSHIFSQTPFFFSSSLPRVFPSSLVPSPVPNQTTHHSQRGCFHKDTAHCHRMFFFLCYHHGAVII